MITWSQTHTCKQALNHRNIHEHTNTRSLTCKYIQALVNRLPPHKDRNYIRKNFSSLCPELFFRAPDMPWLVWFTSAGERQKSPSYWDRGFRKHLLVYSRLREKENHVRAGAEWRLLNDGIETEALWGISRFVLHCTEQICHGLRVPFPLNSSWKRYIAARNRTVIIERLGKVSSQRWKQLRMQLKEKPTYCFHKVLVLNSKILCRSEYPFDPVHYPSEGIEAVCVTGT